MRKKFKISNPRFALVAFALALTPAIAEKPANLYIVPRAIALISQGGTTATAAVCGGTDGRAAKAGRLQVAGWVILGITRDDIADAVVQEIWDYIIGEIFSPLFFTSGLRILPFSFLLTS